MFVVDGNASTYAAVFSKPAAISCSLMMFYRSSMLRVLCPLIRMATAGSRPARIMLLTAPAPPREPPLRSLLLRYAGTKC